MHAAPVKGEFKILLPSVKNANAEISNMYPSRTLLISPQFFNCSPRVRSKGADVNLSCTVVEKGYSFLVC